MKKTFKRALACLLAVLMLTLSMPFAAFAATIQNREWWTEDGVDVSTITATPDYIGYHDPDYVDIYGEEGETPFLVGEGSINIERGDPDFRNTYKPVMGIIVSSLGDASMAPAELAKYYNKFYGYSSAASYSYDTMKSAGKILNPGQLKKGQRIAVTIEYGGFDVFSMAIFKAHWDSSKLKPAYYTASPKNSDTWGDWTKAIRTNQQLYATRMTASESWNPKINEFLVTASHANAPSIPFDSEYIGKTEELPVGKYGFIMGTFAFEVLEDCDLKEALPLDSHCEGGCVAQPYSQDSIVYRGDGLYNITLEDAYNSFAKWAVVYDSYEAGGNTPDVPHEHDYQLSGTTPATCTANEVKTFTCTNADGKCDVLTTTEETANSALGHDYNGALTSLNNGNHTVKCTRCDATQTVACTYTSESAGATCTQAGSIKYTCACGYSYTDTVGNSLGHDFVNGSVVSDTVTTPASCLVDGERTIVKKCTRCDATNETKAPVAKLGHDLVANVETVDATCTTDGSKTTTTTCSRCDYKDVQTEVIAKLGHDLATTVKTVDATCTADGSKTTTTTCSRCDYKDVQTEVVAKLGHNLAVNVETVDATYEADGSKTTTTTCSRCDYNDVKTEVIPMLQGVKVTVVASSLGTATVNGKDVSLEDVTVNVAPNSNVTLTAAPVEGAVFAGWMVSGKLVSSDAAITVKALADATYTPIFQEESSNTFTVVFADRYGNIFNTQTVNSGSEIVIPDAPTISGYTFAGWSITTEEIAALATSTTIQAVYEKNVTVGYTVNAIGCTIDVAGSVTDNTATGVQFDTLVTVKAAGAQAWKIGGTIVAYGESYSFYVGSNVTVEPCEVEVVKPIVAAVSVTEVPAGSKVMASFLATRSMTDDCTYVGSGYIYGKNLANDNITLADVNNAGVKVYYCATASDQFSLNYGIAAQTGKITARAFLAYINAQGNVEVVYAEPQIYVYA